jgi:hypothetical protein
LHTINELNKKKKKDAVNPVVRVRVEVSMIGIGFSAFQSFLHQALVDPLSTLYSGKQKDPEHACSEYRGNEVEI